MGKKKYHVDLTESERNRLSGVVKRRKSESEATKRSLILLACDRLGTQVWTDTEISREYKVNVKTVERLRERYVLYGLDIALSGLPRLNEDKIKFDGAVEARLVSLRCSSPPEGYSSWTLSLLSDKLVKLEVVESISRESVNRLLKKTKLSLGKLKNG
ncbi:MAG: helix-turn-helix domain-containing protein [Arcicella sp.]|nr:helix-turn-helix domain-containing protein [Arcicella sp.]MDZ7935448.1 helix-turn-helix domain-containing protein [Emticicia sp.]